jgi:hypothetical protein
MSPRLPLHDRRIGLALVIVIVLARSVPVLYWADLHFDADQAVTGLMAKHLVEGTALPLFQYAHRYVLVLEAWLVAPLVAVAESSVLLIKSVPVALNVATAALLYWTLTVRPPTAAPMTASSAALSPAVALLATMPIALPAPSTARSLTDALGMNIEPLLFTLLLWLWRERPVPLGITAALAVTNREFALYAIVALLAVDLLRDRSARLWRGRLVALVAFAATWSGVRLLEQYSSPRGPGTTFAVAAAESGSNLSVATAAACVDPRFIPRDVWTMATEMLPFQLGLTSGLSLGDFYAPSIEAGWLWAPLVAVLLVGACRGLHRAWRDRPTPMTWLGLYLVLVGLMAVLAYATTRCGHISVSTLRYTLLSLFVPVGAFTLALERDARSRARWLIMGIFVLWVGVCALAHVSVARELLKSPPGAYRELARYLDSRGIRFIVSDYWIGYHVAFLTGERIKALTDFPRIHDYTLAVRANLDRAVEVRRDREERCAGAVVVARFYVCPASQTSPRP